jgi:hypothetical protein
MDSRIPPQVARFVQASITSIEEIELLVLLQAHPERSWLVAELARELGSTEASIAGRLAGFAALGITASEAAAFRYRPATPELDALLKEVVQAYRERRIALTTLIYARPDHPIRSFADAFRLRKDDPT